MRKSSPVGTVNKYGEVKQEDGTWKYIKKGLRTTNNTTTTKKDIQLFLAKHPIENHILMCWYEIKYKGRRIEFRSDRFVPEEVEERLHNLHTTISSNKELLEKCVEILSPYATKILEEVDKFLENPRSDKYQGFNACFNVKK